MKVFVTGATGYIGFAVASAFAAKGHHVVGLARSAEKAKLLAAAEIQPVIGNMNDPSSYTDAARSCELFIHCAAEMSEEFHMLDRKTANHFMDIARTSPSKHSLIYTSGVWLYGQTKGACVTERSALNPARLVLPRQETEKLVLNANNEQLSTMIIRPGCVYGKSGSLTASWFESAVQHGKTQIVGDGHFHWSMVHIEDLADLYVRVGESYLHGEIFNATDGSRLTVLDCAKAVNRVVNGNEAVDIIALEQAAKTMGDFAECLTLDQHVDSSKANRLLNWQPRHRRFIDGVSRYFDAWKAINR
jgi:nucleoside-diphosphate-sugar epimerase